MMLLGVLLLLAEMQAIAASVEQILKIGKIVG